MKSPRIPIVLLAAGSSSRMGKTVKQLLPWKGGTLVEHMIKISSASKASEVVVVLGAYASKIREVLPAVTSFHLIENKEWSRGMSGSIAFGIDHLEKQLPGSDGVIIMLCDQPLLETSYIDLMIDSFLNGDKHIVASGYGNVPGVPALFGKQYFKELRLMGYSGGAQELLVKYRNDVLVLDPGHQVMDMDVAEEYDQLLQIAKNKDGSGGGND